jgi:Xaa-Pro aminopeptidase
MPFVGTDLGADFDRSIVLVPGMVLVLEPVIWEDGHGGFRSEEIITVTEDGYERLSNLSYEPYGIDR